MRAPTKPLDMVAWRQLNMRRSKWTYEPSGSDGEAVPHGVIFGFAGSTPVTGDFNGDGITEVAVFWKGQWFIDLNGNGRWDEGDLWAKLGHEGDLPVTGDWDGDGKTDIGIFGPAWPGDPMAVKREPGLPDPSNRPSGRVKNVPPTPHEAALGARTMKLTSHGQMREDLIDHVFHYGSVGDRPVTGDWNGDGIDTIGVFRKGAWHVDIDGDGKWTPADGASQFGEEGDTPVVGDWNGDGLDDVGVYRAGTWFLDMNANRQLDAQDKVFEFGGADATPVVGDWDGDGSDEPGVFRSGGVDVVVGQP
jgi:hypothetical protein